MRDRDRGRAWFDQGRYRHEYRAYRRFHVPYRFPRGFYERSWLYGEILPYGWYDDAYYLDWEEYGLPAPPVGCEWVQVGSDAILVDVWSGEVLSVYRNIFWW
jgi:Ni/Co efflux regulator RcnB